jgi:hypothetical protein
MLRIIFLFIYFFLFSLQTYSQELDFVEPNLTPNNIEWSDKPIPKDVLNSKIFKMWKWHSASSSLVSIRWAPVSLIAQIQKKSLFKKWLEDQVGGER